MAAYATPEQLADFMGGGTGGYDPARLLVRATDLIRRSSLGRSDSTKLDAQQLEYRTNATCAQVEFWVEAGEEVDKLAPQGREQIGSFSREAPARLAPRARDYLLMAGMLYRGVGM
jgi:hypothetical protein